MEASWVALVTNQSLFVSSDRARHNIESRNKWKIGEKDHPALLKAKYFPRVAAASCTLKKNMRPWHLTYDLKVNGVLEVVKVHVGA